MIITLFQINKSVVNLQDQLDNCDITKMEVSYLQGRLSAYIEMKYYLESELTHISAGEGYLY